MSAQGTLQSGYRIKRAIEIWDTQTKVFVANAFQNEQALSLSITGHDKIASSVREVVDEFEKDVDSIVYFPKGANSSRNLKAMWKD